MAENSKIEWCDHTFNPWIGCTKVSDGCKHCYAEALMDKRYGRAEWGPTETHEHYTRVAYDSSLYLCQFNDGSVVYRFGKKAAGRSLDGVEHNEFPS